MPLTASRDLSAADWIADAALPWQRLVTFGPAGFEAYARLRLLPDPTQSGQEENDVEPEDWRRAQLPALWEVMGAHTTTPDDCWFCVWEGYTTGPASRDTGYLPGADPGSWRPDAVPALSPEAPPQPALPKVVVPNRAYWLFRGPLTEVGSFDSARDWPAGYRLDGTEPAFVWPADRVWCVAKDVDPHWAGIGASRALVTRLAGDPRLDVVPADPAEGQPFYH